jgi:tetratricopeptide (TPR) repeat protein
MRFPSTSALLLALTALLLPQIARAQDAGGRVVLVLPFDNRSGNPSLNWIGDSFPDTLDQRLNSAGFLTISHDDRAYALDHLGLPPDFRPSRATTIRIAQQLDADYVVVGSYNVANNKISVQAQVLAVNALHLSAPLQDGADLPRLFDAENAIAWKIARQIDPHFNVAEQTFLASPGGVPLPSFENYIRGSSAPTPTERLQRLQAAVTDTPSYAAALLALGKEQYATRDFTSAAATLAKVPTSDRIALEANFYLGLAHFNSAEYAKAETAFAFVAARLPLPEVVNDQGVAASRQGKDAVALFQRASAADPSDEDYHYNFAISLFRRGDTAGALREADAALKLKPTDAEATELRARLNLVPAGTKLAPNTDSGFSPVERIIRTYSEAGFRQAAFLMDQMRAQRMATLPAAEQVTQYTQLGRDYLAQGLLPEAEQQFQSALTADPNAAAPHAGLAQVREQSGNADDARSEAQISNRLSPNAAAFLVLARLDLQANNLTTSADDVAKALKLEPQNTAAIALRNTLQTRGQSLP